MATPPIEDVSLGTCVEDSSDGVHGARPVAVSARGGDRGDDGVTGATRNQSVQIGEVAERTGLGLPTIRSYEESGLVVPTTRNSRRSRLYQDVTDALAERLSAIS